MTQRPRSRPAGQLELPAARSRRRRDDPRRRPPDRGERSRSSRAAMRDSCGSGTGRCSWSRCRVHPHADRRAVDLLEGRVGRRARRGSDVARHRVHRRRRRRASSLLIALDRRWHRRPPPAQRQGRRPAKATMVIALFCWRLRRRVWAMAGKPDWRSAGGGRRPAAAGRPGAGELRRGSGGTGFPHQRPRAPHQGARDRPSDTGLAARLAADPAARIIELSAADASAGVVTARPGTCPSPIR